jgi:predicted PurR-regulated permease PerM
MNKSKRMEQLLGYIALSFLLIGCFVVMKPFLSAVMWGIVLGYSLWPVHRRLLGWLGNRQTLAATLTTLGVAMVLLVPFVVIGIGVADDARALGQATRAWIEQGPPKPPVWIERVPLVGKQAKATWIEVADDIGRLVTQFKTADEEVIVATITTNASPKDAFALTPAPGGINSTNKIQTTNQPTAAGAEIKLVRTLKKAVSAVQKQLISAGLAIGRGILEVALSVFLAFFILQNGRALADRAAVGVGRIAGERGKHLLEVAGSTVRGVVYGILGTALAQGVVAGIGFAIAGVPGAGLLGLLTFCVSALPVGPPMVWIPSVIWLYQKDATGWAIFMLVWGIGVSSLDNVIKPWLISQGCKLPFALILLGVLGGALAFGLIGVFLGPTLVAVAYRLIESWLAMTPEPASSENDSDSEPIEI